MEKAVGPVFLLAALTACFSQEVTVKISSNCLASNTSTVEFQTIGVDEGFNYNRNFIHEDCHDLYNATTLKGANVADCALNSYAAKMNSFSFADNACVGYPFWRANLTECRRGGYQRGGVLLYFADSKLTEYTYCPSDFYKTSIGCLGSSAEMLTIAEGHSACGSLGASFYSVQSVDEVLALQIELLAIPDFAPFPTVALQKVEDKWIWQGSGVEQPLEQQYWAIPVADVGANDCAYIKREANYTIESIGCDSSTDSFLCIVRE